MDLKFGDIQETALIPLAIKAGETERPNARIKDSVRADMGTDSEKAFRSCADMAHKSSDCGYDRCKARAHADAC